MADSGNPSPVAAPSAWITDGHLLRAVWRLSLPLIGAAILQDLFTIVDMAFVSRLGPSAIGAVTFGGTILGVVYMAGMGLTAGCTALVAQAVGSGNRPQAERVAGQSLLMAGGLSILGALSSWLAPWALRMLGADGAALSDGIPYLRISLAGSFSIFWLLAFAAALRGAGDAVTPLWVIGAGNVLNILLDPVLIYGWFGVPALGVAGSAWATVASRTVTMSILVWVFFRGRHKHFHLRLRDLSPRLGEQWRIFRIGVFGSAQMLAVVVSGLALMRIVAPFGTVAVAAYGIGIRLRLAVMMPGIGFGTAAATLVGQNLGARRPWRAARAAWIATALYSGMALAAGVAFVGFGPGVVGLFNEDPRVVEAGAEFLRWYGATFVFMALTLVLSRAMNGAGDTFWPMAITFIGMVAVRLPLAYGLSMWMDDVIGVWISVAVSNIAAGLLFGAAFLWGRWKTIGARLVGPGGSGGGIER